MASTTYQTQVTELVDAAMGPEFEYPSSFESDVDSCFTRHLTPQQAAEELVAVYSEGYQVVWECDYDAWQIHTNNGTIETTDDYDGDHEELCETVGIDCDDTESWSCEITELDAIHERLQVGDKVVCGGFGETVYFLRK